MGQIDPSERSDAKMPARLSKMLSSLLMKRVTIVANEPVADRFRLITLESPTFRGVGWAPGQKMQVAMGSVFATRAYTPIEWNASTGRTRILGYAHSEGLGSAWLRSVEPGDECDVFGPRPSLDLSCLSGSVVIFGDETSIGLAHAAAHQIPGRSVACHFEVDDVARAREVVAHLDLRDATLFARRNDDAHIEAMAGVIPMWATVGATFVLTGKAGTIQALRRSLKQLSVPMTRIAAKAYWAPGKTGLD
jgi:NADPH-dependent ferric siderophore reductase